MCGRYLIDEEAYSDILEILYRSKVFPDAGAIPGGNSLLGSAGSTPDGATVGGIPSGMREAMAATMLGTVSETVSSSIQELFHGAAPVVLSGEVFPTNIAPVLSQDGVIAVKWGFPHWKNSSVIINARAETALEKQMFRKSLHERRCVVLSNGFFEWGSSGENIRSSGRSKKTKYLLRQPDEYKLYMAGFWNTFRDGAGAEYNAFVILTTAASPSVAPIHDRMPVILSPDEKDDWLTDAGFMGYALHRPGVELRINN